MESGMIALVNLVKLIGIPCQNNCLLKTYCFINSFILGGALTYNLLLYRKKIVERSKTLKKSCLEEVIIGRTGVWSEVETVCTSGQMLLHWNFPTGPMAGFASYSMGNWLLCTHPVVLKEDRLIQQVN